MPGAVFTMGDQHILATLGIQSYLLRYGDWRHCLCRCQEGPVVPSEKGLGSGNATPGLSPCIEWSNGSQLGRDRL